MRIHSSIARWQLRLLSAFAGLLFSLAPPVVKAEHFLPLLKVHGTTYSNVTVTTKSPTYIMIMHSHGLASIKLKELEPDILAQLGYKVNLPETNVSKAFQTPKIEVDPRIKELETKTVEEVKERWQKIDAQQLGPMVMLIAGVVALGIYLFFSYCLSLICKKAGYNPGILVWIPILQIFAMLRAAGMSGWWVLLWSMPVINFGVSILWSIKICQARGKSSWLAVPLLLPVTSLFTFLYLAFADSLEEETPERISFN